MKTDFKLAISKLPDGWFAVALSAVVPTGQDAVEVKAFMEAALKEKAAKCPGNPLIIPAEFLPPNGRRR